MNTVTHSQTFAYTHTRTLAHTNMLLLSLLLSRHLYLSLSLHLSLSLSLSNYLSEAIRKLLDPMAVVKSLTSSHQSQNEIVEPFFKSYFESFSWTFEIFFVCVVEISKAEFFVLRLSQH